MGLESRALHVRCGWEDCCSSIAMRDGTSSILVRIFVSCEGSGSASTCQGHLPRKHHPSIDRTIHCDARPLYIELHYLWDLPICFLSTLLSSSTPRHHAWLGHGSSAVSMSITSLLHLRLQNLWLRTLRHLRHVDPGLPFQTFPCKGEIERKDVGADPNRTWTIRSTDVMACEGARMRHGKADESQTTERS